MNNITIIAAIAADNAIGSAGDLLWHISADLRRFKALTLGATVIMGRKTFQSLPGGALKNRRNIIVSRNAEFQAPGTETYPSLEAALQAAATTDRKIYIIGGGQIYSQAINLAHTLEITHIEARYPQADTRFPDIDPQHWQIEQQSETTTDEKSKLNYRFVTYRRK